MGLSMQGLGQTNSQYIANANLQVTKMEKDKAKIIKNYCSSRVKYSFLSYRRSFNNCNKLYNIIYMLKKDTNKCPFKFIGIFNENFNVDEVELTKKF